MDAHFDNIDVENYDYTVKRKTRLIVDAPTDMEMLSIEMSLMMKPEAVEPK